MKKLAIIGASYLQNPLILRAKAMGIETHVFAWEAGDVGERTADFFYPISITEKEAILDQCRKVGVDGIATIGSDLATVAVGYVASHMGLVANSPGCVERSTDKTAMRRAFSENGDPSPASVTVDASTDLSGLDLAYPVIVKPADRSGSRGIAKLSSPEGLPDAVAAAIGQSFCKRALVEEFAEGAEYSVEFVSWKGEHRFLAVTEKFTTGAPHFIERGHLQPARIPDDLRARIEAVVSHALTSLGVEYGASHSELKVDAQGRIRLIEIGARMGGDFIGSNMVQMSTGYDFLKAVIDIALGREPEGVPARGPHRTAAVRFVFGNEDVAAYRAAQADPGIDIAASEMPAAIDHQVTDSSNRLGYFLYSAASAEGALRYLPSHDEEVG